MNLPAKIKEDRKNQKALVKSLVSGISFEEKNELKAWCEGLIQIKNSSKSKKEKLKEIFLITKDRKIIFPILKSVSKSVKKLAWDKRSTKSRLGVLGLGLGLTVLAGQSAGIAALGGAVGVPLWIVFGAGGTFAGFVIEEIERNNQQNSTIIDVDCGEVKQDHD